MKPICRYCIKPAVLLRYGAEGYPYRADYGPIWTCVPCGAWVGCHPGTENALGGLANAELRAAKQAAHAAFDPLWQRKHAREGGSRGNARRAGYAWLAEQLGIPPSQTHIGMMSLEECHRVVEVCTRRPAAPAPRHSSASYGTTGPRRPAAHCGCDVLPWDHCRHTAPEMFA